MKPPVQDIEDLRKLARRTRRIAEGMTEVAEKTRLNAYAAELEQQAREMARPQHRQSRQQPEVDE